MPRPRVTSHQFIVALCLKEEKGNLNIVSFQVDQFSQQQTVHYFKATVGTK